MKNKLPYEIDRRSNEFNYLSIQLLEHIGVIDPTQEQIDLVEGLIATSSINMSQMFNQQLTQKEIACLSWAALGKSSRAIYSIFFRPYDLEIDSEDFVQLCILLCDTSGLGLTKREAEIIAMLLHQWPIAKIANHLSREEKTIHKHLQNIKKKMSCPTIFGLGVKISGYLSQLQRAS